MGKQYKALTPSDIAFVKAQNVFFIASCSTSEVNLSPRGYDCLYIHDDHTIYMLDMLGSGNRTARDIENNGEITLMFTAFEGKPNILRCFCKGEVFDKSSPVFQEFSHAFNENLDAVRHMLKLSVYAVESSCGMGVPLMEFKSERPDVRDYALKCHQNGTFQDYVDSHTIPPDLSSL